MIGWARPSRCLQPGLQPGPRYEIGQGERLRCPPTYSQRSRPTPCLGQSEPIPEFALDRCAGCATGISTILTPLHIVPVDPGDLNPRTTTLALARTVTMLELENPDVKFVAGLLEGGPQQEPLGLVVVSDQDAGHDP